MTNESVGGLAARVDEAVEKITPRMIELRRRLHAQPELAFEEKATAALVAGELAQLGLDVRKGIGQTGVAAVLRNGSGCTVGIRADMDALPVAEKTGLPFASRYPGKMHACGHDVHMAIMLGAAHVLSMLGDAFSGNVLYIAQPAEETLAGAQAMLDDGLFDWCQPDALLGYHVWPLLAVGKIGWCRGAAFAAATSFDVVIDGSAGHGAHPHLSVDPIVAAASFIMQAQTIVSRELAPRNSAVVSFGTIEGGTVRNQIPGQVSIAGTIRADTAATGDLARKALARIAQGVSISGRVRCEVVFGQEAPPVRSDPEILAITVAAAKAACGADNVVELEGSMGSEDFGVFSTIIPSAHLRIGSGGEEEPAMLHSGRFNADERCIPTAIRAVSLAAFSLLEMRGRARMFLPEVTTTGNVAKRILKSKR